MATVDIFYKNSKYILNISYYTKSKKSSNGKNRKILSENMDEKETKNAYSQ